jgi:aminopeptidase
MAILAPENTRVGADVPAERLSARQAALREPHLPFLMDEKPWVGCYFPTTAGAQDAGLTLGAFEDFLYGAVLIDWHELREKMERIAEHFDRAETVRIVGAQTDLTFSLAELRNGGRIELDGRAVQENGAWALW